MRPTRACSGPAMRAAEPPRKSLAWALLFLAGTLQAAQFTIDGPAGSGEFGRTVTVLPNGNIVVTDPGFDAPGPVVNVGAVHLYRPEGTLISTLRGSSANDVVGSDGVTVLSNGNYLVRSAFWDNGAIADTGAVTFVSGTRGISGVVSPANSLVGSTADDRVGVGGGVSVLANGNYLVRSAFWDNGAIPDAGAITFGSGASGITGVVSPANSLVGGTANDQVGAGSVTELINGNYVVGASSWDNGAIVDAGAVTFGSGTSGITGVISPVNSLVGSTTGDLVGSNGVSVLTNGNYVVASQFWDNGAIVDAGAVTFGSGTSGIAGVISPANSLVGRAARDGVGTHGVTVLTNGNYVVRSAFWDNGATANAGAVTFGSGTSGITGVVSPVNSLVGSTASDFVGLSGVTALANGNYVVRSASWDNGATANAGAVTFGSGTRGITGVVSPANSLVGSTTGDEVGVSGVTALTNGNYVVASEVWDNGAIPNAGAVTFGSGAGGITGVVSPANSLVGSTASDGVGNLGVTALTNGNYVVRSETWDNGAIPDAGAATFGSGTSGITGVVSPANSLVGSSAGDVVGGSGVTALTNGNYVVASESWDNGAIANAGAVTFGPGTSGITGVVTPANSLVGGTAGDQVGTFGVTALTNGNYVVRSPVWRNGAITRAGAVTFGSGISGIMGVVSAANSLVGSTAKDVVGDWDVMVLTNGNYVVNSPFWDNGTMADAGAITLGLFNGSVVNTITNAHSVLGAVGGAGLAQPFSYDVARNQLAVGQPFSNRVVLQRPGIATAITIVGETPEPSEVGQPVTFTATVGATPNAPTNGQVTFTASSGESCVDTSPTPITATMAEFSCAIGFTTAGSSTVIAEYTGSIDHAYSGSDPETHTTVAAVFADGFESP